MRHALSFGRERIAKPFDENTFGCLGLAYITVDGRIVDIKSN